MLHPLHQAAILGRYILGCYIAVRVATIILTIAEQRNRTDEIINLATNVCLPRHDISSGWYNID